MRPELRKLIFRAWDLVQKVPTASLIVWMPRQPPRRQSDFVRTLQQQVAGEENRSCAARPTWRWVGGRRQVLISIGDNADRLKSEAAFAHLCGAAPIPASSGRTQCHRLNRGGDRSANNAST
jgi:hypothetical protein